MLWNHMVFHWFVFFFPKIHLERHTTPTPSEVTTPHTPPDIEALPLAVQLLILKQAWVAVKAG